MTRESTDRTAERILRRLRREMIGTNEEGLKQLDAIYGRIAEDLSTELQGVASRATIERIARERFNAAIVEIVSVIRTGVDAAALAGARTPIEQFRAIFPRVQSPRAAVELEAQRAASRAMRGQLRARDVPLSTRLRENHADLARNMSREIQASMRAGESAFETMERVLELNSQGRGAQIPQYIQRLADAARDGGPALEKAIREARPAINRLGSVDRGNTSIRAATEELVTKLRRATAEDIDGIVERWSLDKAQYQAKVIARTEAIAAHRDAYETSMRGKPWTKGFAWRLSGGHKVPDICDILAGQNLHGLGPGCYPVDAVPATPHPSCTCSQTAIIDEKHFERELAQLEGTEPPPETWNVGGQQTPAEWMAQQPERLQQQILGPTRLAVFREEPGRVLSPTGDIRRVRDVLREQPAQRSAER